MTANVVVAVGVQEHKDKEFDCFGNNLISKKANVEDRVVI